MKNTPRIICRLYFAKRYQMTILSWLVSGGVSYFTDKIIYISNKKWYSIYFFYFQDIWCHFFTKLVCPHHHPLLQDSQICYQKSQLYEGILLKSKRILLISFVFFSKTEQNIKRIKRRTKVDIGQKSTGMEHKIECFVDNLECRRLDNDLGYPRKGDKFKMLGQQN